jgi:hypothetical protein
MAAHRGQVRRLYVYEVFADGDVHKYFSPYDSPYDAFVAFMKVLQDLEQSLVRPTPAPAEPLWLEGAEMACVA